VKEQAKSEERFIAEATTLRQRIAELEAAEAEGQRAAEATQQRAQELETLFTIASILALPGNFGVKCRGVLEEIARVVQAHLVALRMPDEEQQGLRTVSAAGEDLERVPPIPLLPYGQSMSSLAFEQGEAIVANDYPAYPGAIPRTVAYGVKSAAALPIKSGGRTLAVITLTSREPNHFSSDRMRLLMAIANELGSLLDNTGLREEARRQATEIEVIGEVARIITSTLTIDQVYEKFAAEMKRLVHFDRVNIDVIDHDRGSFTVKYLYGQSVSGHHTGAVLALEGTLTGQAAATGATVIREDIPADTRLPADSEYLSVGLRSSITIPLVSKGKVIGCLTLWSRRVGAFGRREQHILEGLTTQIAPAVENSLLFEDVRRLALALASIGDAVVFLDPAGHVQFINRAAEELSGYTAAEVRGKPVTLIVPANPGRRTGAREILRQASQAGWRGEVRAVTKDGEDLTLSLTMAPVRGHQESVIGIIGVAQDITERKRMEERMQETSRLISLGELAAGVAHEINNPLTVVTGFSQLLLAEDLPQRARDDLQKIYAEAQRAARIMQNLLSFARKREPEKQYLDVTTVLERAVAMKEHDFRVNNIEVTCHWSRDLPPTMVDEHQLIQAILNILTNAQQAMAEAHGGGELVLRASHLRDKRATRLKDRIRISFSDDGPGILPEHLPRIFDPFFTTKGVGKGTGLGLSISYGIVQQHDGDLWAESLPEKGTIFHLELPVLGPAEEGRPLAAVNLAQAPAKTQRILVVDDEPAIRDLLAKALGTEGHAVDLAESGAEAWHKVQSQTYGCILLDLKMPGMSGQQLYYRMAESDQELARRVIFMTGDTANPDTRDFMSATGNPAVSKPFNVEELRQQIQKSLEATNGYR
jgi:two-component system NtrC family sensor kinase